MAKTPWEMAEVGAEFSHQTALFAWAAMATFRGVAPANDPKSYSVPGHAASYPMEPLTELKWLHAVKNQGHGDAIRGSRSKAEGVKAGVFDLFLPFPISLAEGPTVFEGGRLFNGGWGNWFRIYAGLYIELKKPKKYHVSEEQLEFGRDMRNDGYAAEICVGWEAARDVILRYLGRA